MGAYLIDLVGHVAGDGRLAVSSSCPYDIVGKSSTEERE